MTEEAKAKGFSHEKYEEFMKKFADPADGYESLDQIGDQMQKSTQIANQFSVQMKSSGDTGLVAESAATAAQAATGAAGSTASGDTGLVGSHVAGASATGAGAADDVTVIAEVNLPDDVDADLLGQVFGTEEEDGAEEVEDTQEAEHEGIKSALLSFAQRLSLGGTSKKEGAGAAAQTQAKTQAGADNQAGEPEADEDEDQADESEKVGAYENLTLDQFADTIRKEAAGVARKEAVSSTDQTLGMMAQLMGAMLDRMESLEATSQKSAGASEQLLAEAEAKIQSLTQTVESLGKQYGTLEEGAPAMATIESLLKGEKRRTRTTDSDGNELDDEFEQGAIADGLLDW